MTLILAVMLCYLVIVLVVGLMGHRLFRGTGEDYFLASRTIGSFVLLMTLFGTHMTAFTMLGASGESYRLGIVVYLLMGSSSAFVVPFVFHLVGTRLWWLGKRHRFMTQAQFFRKRYESDLVGLVLFIMLITLLLPYVLIGVKGSGDVLAAITGGAGQGLPSWVGSLVVCVVIFTYVTYGGMRSTAWANTLQTLIFMSVGGIAFFVILGKYGGLGAAMHAISSANNTLLAVEKSGHNFALMLSYMFLPLSAGVFPHIFSHWLSAKSSRTFRVAIVFYPVCIAVVWIPSVVLGIIGNIDFSPPLTGPILVALILKHSGGILAGLLAAGIFAAIMSSVDSQTLAVGTMFTTDIVQHYGYRSRFTEGQQVLFGRLFVMGFLVVVLTLSLITSRSIFSIGVWSLSGFAALFPVIIAALFWRRSTAVGVLSSIVTVGALWVFFFMRSLSMAGEYTIAGTGLLPVTLMFLGSVVSLVLVSLVTRPPREETIKEFFPC